MSKQTLALCLLFVSALAACYYHDAEEVVPAGIAQGHKQSAAPGEPFALFIVTDGLAWNVLSEMMDKGEMPNFKKYIYDRAAVSDAAFTSAPSVTYPNLTSMATGQYGAHTGVAGMKFIFRRELQYRQYDRYIDLWRVNTDCTSPTIMEILGDQYTFVNFFPLFRGADYYGRMFYNSLRGEVFGRWDLHDAGCCSAIAEIYENCHEQVGRYPRCTILYFMGTDYYAHLYGLNSEKYHAYLRYLDKNVGELFQRLDKIGVLDGLLLVHVSDHGMLQNEHSDFNLIDMMRRDMHMRVTDGDFDNDWRWEKRRETFNGYNAVVTISGHRYGYVYLSCRPPSKFLTMNIFAAPLALDQIRNYEISDGTRIDVIASLLKYEAVEHIIARKGDDRIAVFHRDGEAEIERKIVDGKKMYRYTVVSGADPFAYSQAESAGKMLGGKFYTADEWLQATYETEFPDAVVQCCEVFDDNDEVGDLIVYPRPGWELNSENQGAHGGLHHDEMHIPMAFAGPGIRKCNFGPARLVDVMPTVLQYLGFGDRLAKLQNLDGKSVLDKIAEKQ